MRERHILFGALMAALFCLGACNRTTGPDPANANLAQTDQNPPPQSAEEPAYTYPASSVQQLDEAPQPPPPLPEYSQPECPGENYIWTPGYWSYSQAGYYWVPGVWVRAPYVDALWTPGYWGFGAGRYRWHSGYWSRHIGFYGGIDYGFGYTGLGYSGGYWNRDAFVYNRAVNNVSTRVVNNVYQYPVSRPGRDSRVAYYGGSGGIERRPTAAELAVNREQHAPPLPVQVEHVRQAAANRAQFASENHGRPQVMAVQRPAAAPSPAAAPERNGRAAETQTPIRAAQPFAPERNGSADRRVEETRPNAPAREMPRMQEQRPVQEARPVPQQQRAQAPPVEHGQRPVESAPPVMQGRPAPMEQQPVQRQEARPAPVQRPEARPTPQRAPVQRQEARPAPQQAPVQRQEAHPAPQQAPVQRQEARPAAAPAQHAAPPEHQEERPAPPEKKDEHGRGRGGE